jgi:transglutaminase-like putative cysteine protease
MKQLITIIFILLIPLGFVVAFLLTDIDRTAMAIYDMLEPFAPEEAETASSESETEPQTETEPPTPPPEDDPPVEVDDETFAGNYIYSQLKAEERTLYREIYVAMQERAPEILLSEEEQQAFKTKDVVNVYNFVLDDNPGLFWVDFSFSVGERTIGDDKFPTSVRFTYLFDENEQANVQEQIDAYERECLAGLSPDASLFGKILHVYEYVINNTEYVLGSQYNQSMISVALYGESVCKGYAKMTQYLLNRLAIPCVTVNGYAGEPHSWNLVNADGDYYYLDPTWGDPQKAKPGRSGASESRISYEFFMITDEELALTHELDELYPYPVCDSTALNYYTYTRRMFEAYDYDTIRDLMLEDFASGNFCTFRFSNAEAYQTALQRLIDDADAHRILENLEAYQQNGYSFTYSTDDDFRTLDIMI